MYIHIQSADMHVSAFCASSVQLIGAHPHVGKYYIICKPELATLNKLSELVSSCRHARKFLLMNI